MFHHVLSWMRPKEEHPVNKNAVQVMKNIPYLLSTTTVDKEGESTVIDKQCCNIYKPPQTKDNGQKFPVLVFVHGGSWRRGDRSHRWFDVYGNNAKYFAQAVRF
jgi:carboxylesterase type B